MSREKEALGVAGSHLDGICKEFGLTGEQKWALQGNLSNVMVAAHAGINNGQTLGDIEKNCAGGVCIAIKADPKSIVAHQVTRRVVGACVGAMRYTGMVPDTHELFQGAERT